MKAILPAVILIISIACNNTGADDGSGNPNVPSPVGYTVLKTYPHDTSSFTEGLIITNDGLYESTGNYGHSKLMKIDLVTGKTQATMTLDSIFFGEGITILNDTLYQLTWKEKKVFIYTLKPLKKVKTLNIDREGWDLQTMAGI